MEWLAFYFSARLGKYFGEYGSFGVATKVSILHFGKDGLLLCGSVFDDQRIFFNDLLVA